MPLSRTGTEEKKEKKTGPPDTWVKRTLQEMKQELLIEWQPGKHRISIPTRGKNTNTGNVERRTICSIQEKIKE